MFLVGTGGGANDMCVSGVPPNEESSEVGWVASASALLDGDAGATGSGTGTSPMARVLDTMALGSYDHVGIALQSAYMSQNTRTVRHEVVHHSCGWISSHGLILYAG